MKLKLQIAPTHRFAELSIRTRAGKVWIGKDRPVVIDSDELLPGEDVTILRYEEEGRLIGKTLQRRGAD